jgi:hypothetical protein
MVETRLKVWKGTYNKVGISRVFYSTRYQAAKGPTGHLSQAAGPVEIRVPVHGRTVLERFAYDCYKFLPTHLVQESALQYRFRKCLLVGSNVSLLAALILMMLTGCGGTSGASSSSVDGSRKSNHLAVSPATMAFGNVALGSSQSQSGSLTASGSNLVVSSATLSGTGYTLSGITFPLTLPAGQSVPFTVTFTPPAAGDSSGSISFVARASNTTIETLSGSGMQSAHSVSLSWNQSSSSVVGYNVYRGTQTGGPYTKVNPSLQAGTIYTDSSVQSGATYFYVVTALDASSQESNFSNETVAVIPTP